MDNVLNMVHWKVCPLGMQLTSDELQTLRPLSGQIVSCTSSFSRYGFVVHQVAIRTL